MAEAPAEIARQITVHNEQTKIRATLLNTVATGFIVAGVITPIVNASRGGDQTASATLLLMVVWFLLGRGLTLLRVPDLGATQMTEALWLTIGAAAFATIALSAVSIFASGQSARRIDRLKAERAAADRRLREAEADRVLAANLINTQR